MLRLKKMCPIYPRAKMSEIEKTSNKKEKDTSSDYIEKHRT